MLINDFNKVIKVLESCETETQLKVCKNYYELFLKKWNDTMSEKLRLTLMFSYVKLEKSKGFELLKNKRK